MVKGFLKRSTITLLIIATITFITIRIYYALTDDFRLGHITHEMPFHAEWNIPPNNAEEELILTQILNQPYTYLGKGAQSFVFASADGKYVLKFFKFKHIRPSPILEWLPNIGPLKQYKTARKQWSERKLNGIFQSHILAYTQDRNESGLIFIQMNVKNNPERTVTIYDKIGLKYIIDLNSLPFVIQKRGVMLSTTLQKVLKEGNVSEAKNKIDQIFALYSQEYAKGLYDRDHEVDRNTGFIDNTPIHIDIGQLLPNEAMKDPAIARKDALIVGEKLKSWIHKNYKMYERVLSKHIDKTIESTFTSLEAPANESTE